MRDIKQSLIFSNKVKNAKEEFKMNHQEFSIFLGYPRDTVVKWVQGKITPPEDKQDDVLKKIANKKEAS